MAQIADSLIIDIRATFEKLASDVNGAAKTLSGFEKRFSVIGKGLGAAMSAGAALGFAAFVKTATTGFVEIGDRAGDVAEAFKNLGGSSASIGEAEKATMGLVSATNLMEAANKGLLKGIPELNQNFASIAGLATRVAEATGKDATGAINDLVSAISTGKVKSLKEFGILAEKGMSTAEILKLIPDALSKLPPVSDDVATATARLSNSWEHLKEVFGQAQNEADSTRGVMNLLREAVDDVARGIDYLTGATTVGKIVKLQNEIAVAQARLNRPGSSINKFLGINSGLPDEIAQKQEELNALLLDGNNIIEQRIAELNAQKKIDEQNTANAKKLNDEYSKFKESFSATGIKNALDEAIKSGNGGAFRSLAKEYEKSLNEASTKVLEEWADKGKKVSKEDAETFQKTFVQDHLNPFFEKWNDAEQKAAEKAAEELQKGFEDSVNFFSDIFTSVMEGSVMSLGDMLKQVAIGFAAQMAASMTGFSIAGGPGGIGMQIASSLGFGSTTQGINSVGGQIAGAGLSAAGAYFGSGAVATYGSGVMAGVTGTTTVASTAAGAAGVQAGAAMMSAAPYVAAAVGAYLVAKHFGAFGTGATNKETLARKDVVNWLEDKLKKDIKLGANDRFNTSAGFATLDSLPHHAKTAFQGVGGALNALLGITENTGGQIGAILADNYGSFDELKHMIQGLGVSLQEFTDKIIATGIEANDTWDTIQNKIDAVTEAMTPGLTAIGAYTEAINNLTASGGRGMDAIQGLQDAVIEAKEAGFRTLDQWKQKMLSEGKLNSDQINKIFQAFADMGITSMEQLANASVQQLGQIIARLFELGYAFEDTAKKADESSTKISGAIPGATPTGTTLNSNANSAKGNVFTNGKLMRFAKGGIFNSPTLFNVGMMGEAGPEAIMPLVRKNGRLGVRASGGGSGNSGLSINIDARGAAPGVEYEVARAINAMKDELVGLSVAATQELYRRRGTLSQG